MTAEKRAVAQKDFGGRRPPLQEAEWEVLPPEGQGAQPAEPLFRWVAFFMDNLFRIPGTNFRVGLDPIIGLIPGIGDTSAALVSAATLIQAARSGIPKIVIARMAANVLLNEIIGIIPGLGDAFSFWFKSNARNHELLKKHLSAGHAKRRSGKGDWIFVIGVLVLIALIVGAGIFLTFYILREGFRVLSGV